MICTEFSWILDEWCWDKPKGVPGSGGGSVVVRVRVGRVAAAVALVDWVGGARPHVEHDDEDEDHDAEGRHYDADHLSADNAVQCMLKIYF